MKESQNKSDLYISLIYILNAAIVAPLFLGILMLWISIGLPIGTSVGTEFTIFSLFILLIVPLGTFYGYKYISKRHYISNPKYIIKTSSIIYLILSTILVLRNILMDMDVDIEKILFSIGFLIFFNLLFYFFTRYFLLKLSVVNKTSL